MAKQMMTFSDLTNKNKFLFISTLLVIITLLMYFSNKSYDEFYRQLAIKSMQKECAQKCASYGVSLGDLVGPTLEYAWHNRFQSDYIFSWHSKNPAVTVKVHEYHNSSSEPETIVFEWSSSKN